MTKSEEIRAECSRRKLQVVPFGRGFWIRGAGVDLLVAGLRYATSQDLQPAQRDYIPFFKVKENMEEKS